MSSRPRKIPKTTRFEDALAELEDIVRELESGEQSLESSLAQFERGVSLSRYCQQSLKEAEQKVQILVEQDGEEQLQELDTPTVTGAASKADNDTSPSAPQE